MLKIYLKVQTQDFTINLIWEKRKAQNATLRFCPWANGWMVVCSAEEGKAMDWEDLRVEKACYMWDVY